MDIFYGTVVAELLDECGMRKWRPFSNASSANAWNDLTCKGHAVAKTSGIFDAAARFLDWVHCACARRYSALRCL